MISLTKMDSVLAASLCAVCGSAASVAHAVDYQISVYEGTFGPAGNIPYQNGIIWSYVTDPDGPGLSRELGSGRTRVEGSAPVQATVAARNSETLRL